MTTTQFLSASEVAARIGVQRTTLARYQLPIPDGMIGATRGWLPATIDKWAATRAPRVTVWHLAEDTPNSIQAAIKGGHFTSEEITDASLACVAEVQRMALEILTDPRKAIADRWPARSDSDTVVFPDEECPAGFRTADDLGAWIPLACDGSCGNAECDATTKVEAHLAQAGMPPDRVLAVRQVLDEIHQAEEADE